MGDKTDATWHPDEAPRDVRAEWKALQDGWGHTDTSGRLLEARFSRFHGLMFTVTGDGNKMASTVYVGDALPDLLEYIVERAPEALALHDAEVKAQALDEAADVISPNDSMSARAKRWLTSRAAAIRAEANG